MWSTVAVELLESIILFTKSPHAVAAVCRTCKNWREVGADAHLWKYMYQVMAPASIVDDSIVNWKSKVVDLVLIRKNVRNGRCIVRTLATNEQLSESVTLQPDNYTAYKDYCLMSWTTSEYYESYGNVIKLTADVINMAREEIIPVNTKKVLFLNHFVAKGPTPTWGGATFARVKVQKFDPKAIAELSFTSNNSIKVKDDKFTDNLKEHIPNHCPDSTYIGFSESSDGSCLLTVVDGETGLVVYSQNKPTLPSDRILMYDHTLIYTVGGRGVGVVDVLTKKETKKTFNANVVLGFATADTVALRTNKFVTMWNYRTNKEVNYPSGPMPMDPIAMIYNDMWLLCGHGKLRFYSMKDGSLINVVNAQQSTSRNVSLLSDGRLGLAQEHGCCAISFMDSEVNRKIKVRLVDIGGKVALHEIPACEIIDFFTGKTKKSVEGITSRVFTDPETPVGEDERLVMMFWHDRSGSQPVNEYATTLFSSAQKPTYRNTPLRGWKVDCNLKSPIHLALYAVTKVHGTVAIVREKKVDGRWQLVSI